MPRRLDPMPLVDPVRRFILFTNPKCGGTTLKAWFFYNLDLRNLHRRPARLAWSYGPRFFSGHLRRGRSLALEVPGIGGFSGNSEDHKAALRHFTHFYRAAFCLREMRSRRSDGYFRICVVRNPYDRIVSAYLDKLCSEGRFGREAPYVQRMLSDLGRSELTFREFLAFLRTVDEEQCAIHWRRQTFLLEGQRIDAFVRLEALHEEMARHAHIVGAEHLDILKKKMQATRTARCDAAAAPDLTDMPNLQIAAERRANGRFPSRASFLTPETRKQIREIYALDFERLPYQQ